MDNNLRDKWGGMNHMDLVIDATDSLGAVYLGNIESARNVPVLLASDITAVLTVAESAGIKYDGHICFHLTIPCLDNEDQDLTQFFQECVDFIEHKRQLTNVLVHCFAGVSRSATMVICYLI